MVWQWSAVSVCLLASRQLYKTVKQVWKHLFDSAEEEVYTSEENKTVVVMAKLR
jgi:hypothetical protein